MSVCVIMIVTTKYPDSDHESPNAVDILIPEPH
jgi:hypothetical protein